MGYTTRFKGSFKIDKPLSPEHAEAVSSAEDLPGIPGGYCQWVYDDSRSAIVWDGGEKFYGYITWIRFLSKLLTDLGYKLNGHVRWSGEESADRGIITARDGAITWDGSNENRGGEDRDLPKPPPDLTYGDLLAKLQAMSPDQLRHKIIWMCEERGGIVKELMVTEEDQVCPDEETWEPRAKFIAETREDYDMTQEEAVALPIVSVKGQPYLMVD